MDDLICPVCSRPLSLYGKSFKCENSHSFDISKEGYVNLLTGSKSGEKTGDNKLMAQTRRDFLNKGYYERLSDTVNGISANLVSSGFITDICCGDGYYTSRLAENTDCFVSGFDISKEMVRLAAKRKSKAFFFVANMARIPVLSSSQDMCVHMFAPFNAEEFARITKPGGYLISVVPGKYHLYSLKRAVYDEAYLNGENERDTGDFDLIDSKNLTYDILLSSNEDIKSLFTMTPYGWRTSRKDAQKLDSLNKLKTELDFDILIYKKTVI